MRYVGVGLSGGMAVGAVLGLLLGLWFAFDSAVGGGGADGSWGAELAFLPLYGIVLGGLAGALPGLVAGLVCALGLPRVADDRARGQAAWVLGGGGNLLGLVGLVAALAASGSGLSVTWTGVVVYGVIAAVPMGWLMSRAARAEPASTQGSGGAG